MRSPGQLTSWHRQAMVHKLLSSSLPALCSPPSSTQGYLLVLLAIPGFCAPALARTVGSTCTSENEPESP